jgi:hypothetical protein
MLGVLINSLHGLGRKTAPQAAHSQLDLAGPLSIAPKQ